MTYEQTDRNIILVRRNNIPIGSLLLTDHEVPALWHYHPLLHVQLDPRTLHDIAERITRENLDVNMRRMQR